MSSITVKNIPENLYERLRRSAAANHRSINKEIIVCIERAIGDRKETVETIIANARRLREMTRNHPITDAQFTRAKRAGRP